MAEICNQSSTGHPLLDATAWLTNKGQRGWTFVEWRPALHHPHLIAGMRGILDAGISFTLRHDWDSRKLYHVNVQRGAEKRAYIKKQTEQFDTEGQAIRRYRELTNYIHNHGDANAQEWFMSGCRLVEWNLNYEP